MINDLTELYPVIAPTYVMCPQSKSRTISVYPSYYTFLKLAPAERMYFADQGVFGFLPQENGTISVCYQWIECVGYDDSGQPNGQDWYSGQVRYDETTGESTVLWERGASTLKSLSDHRGFYRGDTTRKVVYFTFDCGYEQDGLTGTILDTLKEKHVSGTFFINGYYVESAADYIRRMLDEGHIVANHSLNHEMLTGVSVRTFYDEVIGLEEKYYKAFPDAPPMLYFRPPSGNCNNWVLTYAEKLGYVTALYSFAYNDWDTKAQPDLDAAFENLKIKLHPGCVYLFHTVSSTNAKLIPMAIDWIREQGYEILPLCDIEA